MRSSALFARDRTLRREIRRWWTDEPIAWAAWLMLNPSNATERTDDLTALRVTQFTARWGYGGWIGVNLYPFIASKPAQMWRWADWKSGGPEWSVRDDLAANLEDIERVARLASLRIVAFGAEPIRRDPAWLEQCLEAFQQPADRGGDERLFCLSMTKHGQPLHPLARGKHRVADTAPPFLWEARL
jgi:hypothetical protein